MADADDRPMPTIGSPPPAAAELAGVPDTYPFGF